MSSHSQNSITDQLAQLQKEAAIAEQTLGHRKAEAQAVQEKIDKLKADFDRKTEKLLAEQKLRLNKAEAHSQELRDHLLKKIESGSQELFTLKKQVDDTEIIVSGKITEIERLEKETISLNAQISSKNDEIKQIMSTIAQLNIDQQATELRITDLSAEENRLKTSISTLEDTFKEWQQRNDTLDQDYITSTDEREAAIKLSDAKLLKVTQELTEREKAEASTRDELAKWQHILDERDQNLRIREAKVEQGEGKLIQNANLLNL